jgi:hypothetical protein
MDAVQDKSLLLLESTMTGIVTDYRTNEKHEFNSSGDFFISRKTVGGQMHLSMNATAYPSDAFFLLEVQFAEADPKSGVYEVGKPELNMKVGFPFSPDWWFHAVPKQTLFLQNSTPDLMVAGEWTFNADSAYGDSLRAEINFKIYGIQS